MPFLAGWTLLILGIGYGLNWIWTTTVFTGNLLVQTIIPTKLIVLEGAKAAWLVAAVVGLVVLLGMSFGTRRSAVAGGLLAPKWRFYPTVMLFGAFLLALGAYFLFDLRMSFDDTSAGFVMFTSLNYANLLDRPIAGTIGLVLFVAGAAVFLGGTLGFRSPRPARSRTPAAQPRGRPAGPSAPGPEPAPERAATAGEPPGWLEAAQPLEATSAPKRTAAKRSSPAGGRPAKKRTAAKRSPAGAKSRAGSARTA